MALAFLRERREYDDSDARAAELATSGSGAVRGGSDDDLKLATWRRHMDVQALQVHTQRMSEVW